MSELTTPTVQSPQTDAGTGRRRPRRLLAFRLLVLALALLFIIGFGVWQSFLTPWVTLPDPVDHGWPRTAELHRVADSVSAAVMGSMGVGAFLLAVRPLGRSALVVWLVGMLAAVGISSVASSLVQGHDPVGAVVFAAAWGALIVAPVALLAPDRRVQLPDDSMSAGEPRPSAPLRLAFAALALGGVLLALGSVAWRLSGGIFEDPREDDVFGLVLLGLNLGLGALLCHRGRAGWRVLALVLAGTTAYVMVALISLALLG